MGAPFGACVSTGATGCTGGVATTPVDTGLAFVFPEPAAERVFGVGSGSAAGRVAGETAVATTDGAGSGALGSLVTPARDAVAAGTVSTAVGGGDDAPAAVIFVSAPERSATTNTAAAANETSAPTAMPIVNGERR